MLSRALQLSSPASLIRGFCTSPQAAEVVKEIVEQAQTNGQAQAAIPPEQFLTRVFGTSPVSSEVKERLLLFYLGQRKHSRSFITSLSRQSANVHDGRFQQYVPGICWNVVLKTCWC